MLRCQLEKQQITDRTDIVSERRKMLLDKDNICH